MKEEETELSVIIAKFLAYKRDFKKSKYRTVNSYADHLRAFAEWIGDRDIRLIPWEEVDDWINRLKRNGDLPSRRTVRTRTVMTTNFYKYLRDVARLPLSDDAVMVAEMHADKVSSQRQAFISDGDWLSVYLLPPVREEPDVEAWYWPGITMEDIVWLGLGYYWGFRAIEIMSIRPHEVEVDNRFWLDFERKGPEGVNRHRFNGLSVFEEDLVFIETIGPPERFLEALAMLVKHREGERFLMPATQGEHIEVRRNRVEWIATDRDTQWLNRRLDIILRNNHLNRKLFTPHSLRHSAATNLARSGAKPEDIKFILNHQDYNTTLSYIHLDEVKDQREFNERRRQRRAFERMREREELDE